MSLNATNGRRYISIKITYLDLTTWQSLSWEIITPLFSQNQSYSQLIASKRIWMINLNNSKDYCHLLNKMTKVKFIRLSINWTCCQKSECTLSWEKMVLSIPTKISALWRHASLQMKLMCSYVSLCKRSSATNGTSTQEPTTPLDLHSIWSICLSSSCMSM